MKRFTQAILPAAILAASLAGGAAVAQTGAPAAQQHPPAMQQPAAIPNPSDAQLEKFAGASQKVAMVAQEYRPKFEAAPDDAARQEVLREADEKMVSLVRADGLTVDEYNGIGQAVQQNPDLQQRVQEMAPDAVAPTR